MTAPPINVNTFPYKKKWSKAELDEILDRKDRLVEAMTDAVGPSGQALYLPPDLVHIMALHVALAGGEVRDELAYIVARVRPDESGMFQGAREWLLKKEYTPAPPDPDKTAVQAKAAAEQVKRQLDPDVRQAMLTILADEFKTSQGEPTKREVAEGRLNEAQLRQQLDEDGD